MSCCKKYNLNVHSIATDGDITTITLADGAMQDFIDQCNCPEVNLCINTSFEVTRECTRIQVTDGTSTFNIAKCNQYWRPTKLKCNSVIRTEYRVDPQLLVFKGGVCRD